MTGALPVDCGRPPDVKVVTLIRNLLDPVDPYRYFGSCDLTALFTAMFDNLYVPIHDYSTESHSPTGIPFF
jgi:hypothetical protein